MSRSYRLEPDAPLMADPVAERVVLSGVLQAPRAFRDTWEAIPDGVWHDGRHELIAQAITGLYRRDLFIDGADDHETLISATEKVTAEAVRADGSTDHRSAEIARLVSRLATDLTPGVLVPRYIDRITYLAQLRAGRNEALRFLQRLDAIADADEETGLPEAVHEMRTALDGVEKASYGEVAVPMALAELLEGDLEYDWLIPGLFERGDRLLLTGFEGGGKSELIHQIASCIAGQVHPFTSWPLPPKPDGSPYRVMVADAENSRAQLRRRLSRHMAIVDRCRRDNDQPPMDWSWLTHRIELRPDGMELTNADEVARLSLAIEKAAPDVLAIGPLYKLTTSDLNDATAVREVLSALDRLRVRHDCVLLIEHHPGHERAGAGKGSNRALRPAGSSLLMRWPEFGRGLMPIEKDNNGEVALVQWRRDRDLRAIPSTLIRGGKLPWTPGNDAYYADADSYTEDTAAATVPS